MPIAHSIIISVKGTEFLIRVHDKTIFASLLIGDRAAGSPIEVVQFQLVIRTFFEDLKAVELEGVLCSIPQPGSEANWSRLRICQVMNFCET